MPRENIHRVTVSGVRIVTSISISTSASAPPVLKPRWGSAAERTYKRPKGGN